MLIVQISDTHIVERGRKTLGVAPMEENLKLVIEHINQLIPKPDLVVLSGDVTDHGLADEYANAARLLSKLNCPYYVIPGNHDRRENLWNAFSDNVCPAKTGDFINYVIEDFEIRLIGMDSTIEGGDGGELCKARLEWLEKQLSEQPHRPTIVFMHHPPVKCGVIESDLDGFIGADELGNIVENYSNIERIICGHIHLPTHSRFHGTIVSTAPSIGTRLGLDLTMKKESEFFLDDPAYQLHHWTKYKNLITHTIRLNEVDGPYAFEEH